MLGRRRLKCAKEQIMRFSTNALILSWSVIATTWAATPLCSQEPQAEREKAEPPPTLVATDPRDAPYPGLKRLMPDADVWVDPKEKRVVLRGEIVLRRGALEL